VTPETPAAACDGFVAYDELRGAGPRRCALEPGEPAAPDGREHVSLDPNAELIVGEARCE
jgi:hypothetical protein